MKIHSLIWVCQCCMLSHANGECCADDSHGGDGIEPWSNFPFDRLDPAMGGEHAEGCVNAPDSPERGEHDCDCETTEFSRSQCEGCGSYLHGTRYAFTLFYRD